MNSKPVAAAFMLFVVVACVGACATPLVLTPPRVDYPCNAYRAHLCSLQSGGGCCDEQEICGHDTVDDPTNTCPAATCCYVGPGPDIAPPKLGTMSGVCITTVDGEHHCPPPTVVHGRLPLK